MLELSGWFVLDRPFTDLDTVFDMAGLALRGNEWGIRSDEPGVTITVTPSDDHRHGLEARIEGDAAGGRELVRCLALALESDGIPFELALTEDGRHVERFEPVG